MDNCIHDKNCNLYYADQEERRGDCGMSWGLYFCAMTGAITLFFGIPWILGILFRAIF